MTGKVRGIAVGMDSPLDWVGGLRLKRLTLYQHAIPPSNESFNFPHLEALELSEWMMDRQPHRFFSWIRTP